MSQSLREHQSMHASGSLELNDKWSDDGNQMAPELIPENNSELALLLMVHCFYPSI